MWPPQDAAILEDVDDRDRLTVILDDAATGYLMGESQAMRRAWIANYHATNRWEPPRRGRGKPAKIGPLIIALAAAGHAAGVWPRNNGKTSANKASKLIEQYLLEQGYIRKSTRMPTGDWVGDLTHAGNIRKMLSGQREKWELTP